MTAENRSVTSKLPQIDRQIGIPAYLIEYPDNIKATENRLYEFQYNPAILDYTREARYSEAGTWAAKVQDQQYYNTSGESLTIDNLVLDGWCQGRSVKPLIDGINALLETAADKFAPPILQFIWGTKRFGPCVLKTVRRQETNWLAGDPARAILSITLLEIPKPENPDAKSDITVTVPTGQNLPLPLTERQQADAKTLATQAIQSKLPQYSPIAQNLINSGNFDLATNKNTGIVSLSSGNAVLGDVLKYDGRTTRFEGIAEP